MTRAEKEYLQKVRAALRAEGKNGELSKTEVDLAILHFGANSPILQATFHIIKRRTKLPKTKLNLNSKPNLI